MMELVKAFVIGGLICCLVQILLDKTKLMPGRVMVLLVVSGAVLGWAGIYGFWKLSLEGGSQESGRRWFYWHL